MIRRLCVLALALSVSFVSHAPARSLRTQLGQSLGTVGLKPGEEFDSLAANIADTAARSLPTISASSGFTYKYNPAIEAFERTSDSLGPLFLERPDTLGKGKFNANVSFQYVQFDSFDGEDLGHLEGKNPVVLALSSGGVGVGAEAHRLQQRIKLQNYVTAFSLTYGILDDLDVNVLLPVIATNMDLGVRDTLVGTAASVDGPFDPAGPTTTSGQSHGNSVGIGDVLLRTKYQLPVADWLHSAIGLQLRLPTGSKANFHGTGAVEVSPFFVASTRLWDRVEPHVNLGVDYNTKNVSRSSARYGVGVDVDAHPRVGLSLGFLGRSEFGESAPKSATLFRHLQADGSVQQQQLFGLDFGRKDFFDLSFGVRVVVWKNIMLFANGIYALNDSGLRNDTIIPAGGIEGTF